MKAVALPIAVMPVEKSDERIVGRSDERMPVGRNDERMQVGMPVGMI